LNGMNWVLERYVMKLVEDDRKPKHFGHSVFH